VTLERRQKLIIGLGLIAATLAAYEPIRHNGFVSYDDPQYITENADIKAGITWQSLGRSFIQPHYFMWHPLTTLSHKLDWQLFGSNPLGHHLVSLVFHIVNALLLFWILTNITGSTLPSAFVAAVFALHPLQVESVAWAAERKTVLSGLFWLLTIAVYIWFTKRPSLKRNIFLFLVYGLCIMTKPVVVTLPLVLLLLDYWPLERFEKASIKRLVVEKIPLLTLSAILSVITFAAQHKGGAVVALEKICLRDRIGNMFTSYAGYIGKTIWPKGLAVIYPYRSTSFSDVGTVGCIILFILMLFLSVYTRRRRKYVTVGLLWYIGTLVPVIGLIQSGSQAMANRYMYIPILGLLIIVAWGVKDLISDKRNLQIVAAISAGAVLTTALILTRTQVRYWQDSLTLFEHTLRVTENNQIAENSYGCALFDLGRENEAILHLNKAVKISPLFKDARCNLGKVFLKEGKFNEAIACFNEVIKQDEDFAEAHYNLGLALGKQKRYDEAIQHFNKVLKIDPHYPDAYKKIGLALYESGRNDEAIALFNRILQKNEGSAEAHYNLAVVLGRQKKFDEAIEHLAKALKIDPNYPDARNRMGLAMLATDRFNEAIEYFKESLRSNTRQAEVYANLGSTYHQLGEYEQAISNLTRAVELDPNNADTLNNLAWTLATVNDSSLQDANRAIGLARRACELTGDKKAEHLDTLAAAYAAAGRFEEAVKTAGQAIETAKTEGREDLVSEIQGRMELYKTGKRYLQK